MGDDTGIRSRNVGPGVVDNDGQHRQPRGGASGDASGIRSVPANCEVGQERGGDQAESVKPPAKDADFHS